MHYFDISSLFVDIILLIVAAGTRAWVVGDGFGVGLLTYCYGGLCAPTLSLMSLSSNPTSAISQCKAAQGFIVLAILNGVALLTVFILRIVGEVPGKVKDFMDSVPLDLEVVLAFAQVAFTTIVWPVSVSLRFIICGDGSDSDARLTCEVHYSFVLMMIVWGSSVAIAYRTWDSVTTIRRKLLEQANAVQNLQAAPAVPAPGQPIMIGNALPAGQVYATPVQVYGAPLPVYGSPMVVQNGPTVIAPPVDAWNIAK
ncbi:membrane-associated protein, putative [Bodo saltans]|uniref:Membrane-associated protein, putative n=1 Tax=Bodo saltans TaxID=75058 RepID=A0A0S4J3F6_BODSA|nr:membrane-associated protein, putative [Bodo saltans]|eukprot:CUG67967.1 membrane-associated protein, putative [Bodo saltans]